METYVVHDHLPTKLRPVSGGGVVAWRLNPGTGGWDRVELDAPAGEPMARDDFIQLVERWRVRIPDSVAGGPVAALYDTIRGIEAAAHLDDRDFTPTEQHLLVGLRRQTYRMVEAELTRRGDPGADPSPDD